MTTKQLERRVIERTERLNSSANGNPRFRFYFTDGSDAVLSSDASFGYEAENPEYRAGRTVDVSFTRAGRVEYMRSVEAEPTARETNLEIAHKRLVDAKYALNALAHDRTLNERERADHESDARIVDALVTRVCLQRLDDVAEAGDMNTSDGLGA